MAYSVDTKDIGSSLNANPIAATGAKYFGTSMAPQSVNPNAKQVNKFATVEIAGMIIAGVLVAYFIYKKVK